MLPLRKVREGGGGAESAYPNVGRIIATNQAAFTVYFTVKWSIFAFL